MSTPDDQPKKSKGLHMRSVSRQEEEGLHRRQWVVDKGCVYGTVVVGRRGRKRWGVSLLSDWPSQNLGRGAVVQNRKPARSKGASCSLGGGGGGGKGKLGAKL